MTPRPVELKRRGDEALEIHWDDGKQSVLSVLDLRRNCPCATCREKRNAKPEPQAAPAALPVLSAAETQPLAIRQMRPVGNYAYNIAFSDEHDSGIYPFDLLYHWDEQKADESHR